MKKVIETTESVLFRYLYYYFCSPTWLAVLNVSKPDREKCFITTLIVWNFVYGDNNILLAQHQREVNEANLVELGQINPFY